MTREYEILVIFPASAKEEAVEKMIEKVRQDVARVNGVIAETENLGLRNFARPLRGADKGYYVRLICTLEPSQVDALKGRFRLNEEIFRFMITKREKADVKVRCGV